MKNNKTLILSGLGLNCEKETAYACEKSGSGQVDVIHTLNFLRGDVKVKDYQFIVFIGGFLDGDYLGSARVGVNRFKYAADLDEGLKDQLQRFIDSGNLILGICNGFQLLVKLGLLPDESKAFIDQSISLTQNSSGIFEDRWVNLKVYENNIFTKGISTMYLPVRHAEGRIVVTDDKVKETLVNDKLIAMQYTNEEGEITDQYPHNPNGSWNDIAALTNKKGNILGLMPHPEAYNHYTNHPQWTRLQFEEEDGQGLKLFKNAYSYLNS
jgi:phosphoribosylformylglycinamidine synthase